MLTRDNIPMGFAMLRRFGRGWSIAPVVAANAGAAKALILHWLRENTGRFTRIDVAGDTGLSKWLTKLGCHERTGARTMVHGALPEATEDFTVFALTAHALG